MANEYLWRSIKHNSMEMNGRMAHWLGGLVVIKNYATHRRDVLALWLKAHRVREDTDSAFLAGPTRRTRFLFMSTQNCNKILDLFGKLLDERLTEISFLSLRFALFRVLFCAAPIFIAKLRKYCLITILNCWNLLRINYATNPHAASSLQSHE